MKIHLITMWYNEEFLAPFFLNHYAWVDTIHILLDADTSDHTEQIARQYSNVEIEYFQFPDMMNDIIKSTAISHKYLSIRDADYVIIVDSDEFIFPWDTSRTVREHLSVTGYDAYFVNLWQIYKHESDCPLDPELPVYRQRRHGDPEMETLDNIGYLKPIVVKGGLDIFWGIGNHYIVWNTIKLEWATRQRAGETPLKVATTHDTMLQGAHWRLVDLGETITRRIANRKQRQSAVNLDKGLTAHYHQTTEADIIKEYENHKNDPLVLHPAAPDSQLDLVQLERLKGWFELATAATNRGDNAVAVELYRQCLQVMPELHDARLNMASCFGSTGDFDTARQELTVILCDLPEHRQARRMLGGALLKLGRAEEALEQFMLLHRQAPDDLDMRRMIAETLYALQHYDEARSWLEPVVARQPGDYATLLIQAAIERTENPSLSLSLYYRLSQQKPDDHRTRLFHATLLLSLGRFEEGWREFEQRIPTLQMSEDILSLPRWHGQSLMGKSIVLVAEQGHGDALQFIRYAPLVAGQGARVMVLCHNDQIRQLLATVEGVESALIPREPLPFLPDYYCPLMSLPFELGTTLETVPNSPGYLRPDLAKKKSWQARLAPYPGIKVGIVWAGNRAQADNSKRSVPFGVLRELFQTPGVTFVSLQVGPDALKYQAGSAGAVLVDWTDDLLDFTDTAALVSSLDLVISICSAVTHLSGGLGIPTWVMLQYDADWRWLRDRNDSPWYPSMRLFRQPKPREWAAVLDEVRRNLQKFPAFQGEGIINSTAVLYQRGVAHFNAGDLNGAEECFRSALQLDDRHNDSLNGLATILDLQGKPEEAIALYRHALQLAPNNVLILFNLANTLRKINNKEEAESLYRQAIRSQPGFYQAWGSLGNLLLQTDRADEAEHVLQQAIQLNPVQADALCDLGVLATQRGESGRAEEYFKQALACDHQHPATLNHLGMHLMRLNRLDEAESYLRQALAAKPDYWLALNNLGVLLHWLGRLDESEECHRRFIAAQPENGTPHFNLSLVLLSHGKWAEAWAEYEYRFTKENPVPLRHDDIPRWCGEELQGKTILIHAEQGYGDTIQFARYLPLLVERGARIVLECQDQIIRPLFDDIPGIDHVIVRDEAHIPVDLQLPLMSLPLLLGETAWHEPVSVRYLKPQPQSADVWRKRLADLPGLKVGLVWSGRRGQDNNHNRMIPPEVFARLAGIAGVSFVNLLVGVHDPEADRVLAALEMFDVRKELTTFADTAAILASLDLLISVDTATPHLAGAIGTDTWVMIPYNADWRWTFGLPDCPLYPSVRLYRQEKPFAWEEVIDSVRRDLVARIGSLQQSPDKLLRQARACRDQFRWQEALESYRHILAHDSRHKEALFGVGSCLQMLNRCDQAIVWYEHAAALLPDDPLLHCNRALALLTVERYREGWEELQWRKRLIGADLPPFPYLTPDLIVDDLSGKSVLIHTEQGFGDTIHAIRYARLLAERGARTVVSAPPELTRLLSHCPGVFRAIPHGETLPVCDFQTLMMDLPWLFGTTRDTIPYQTPYLAASEEILAKWRPRIATTDSLKVGLVWKCGGGGQLNRELRSFVFDRYLPLLSLPGIDYYSLQIGNDALDSSTLLTYNNLHDLTSEIRDFADTAALITLLDHVITIDSAVAHLAGALGKPVSLLLPDFREWRWLDQDGYAIWYPTVRVFAKTASCDWSEPIQSVKDHITYLQSLDAITKPTIAQRNCRLCHATATFFYSNSRPFFICPTCGLIFSDNPLSNEVCEEHYCKQHDTEFDYSGYAQKILTLVGNRVALTRILDFGSGAGRLAEAFRNMGYAIDCYEPMVDGEFNLERYPYEYDLVIANEVIEHVSDIIDFFDTLNLVCRAGGILYISTLTSDSMINDPHHFTERFSTWWYKDDLTHISFFNLNTFEYICGLEQKYDFQIIGYGVNGILLQKKDNVIQNTNCQVIQ